MKEFNDKIDTDIREMMRALPEESVHPSTKVDLMSRIERHSKRWMPESKGLRFLLRASGAALIASFAVMIYFTPIMIKYAQDKQTSRPVEVTAFQSTNSEAFPVSRYYGAVSPGVITVANR